MNSLTPNIQKQALANLSRIEQGLENIQEVCREHVAMVDKCPELPGFLLSKGVSEAMLDLIERVGRNQMTPKLLFMPGPGPERLLRLPVKEQERLLAAGVEVVRMVGDEMRSTVKPVSELTRIEAEIAINSDGNVSKERQTAALQERILNNTFRTPPVRLQGDELYVREKTRIPFADLERYYRDAKLVHDTKTQRLEADIKARQIRK